MPDGFNPHTELAKIMTLKELMVACRQRAPLVLERIDEMLNEDWLNMTAFEKMALLNMILDRGFGKPRQHMVLQDGSEQVANSSSVKVYLPENNRNNYTPRTIEAET